MNVPIQWRRQLDVTDKKEKHAQKDGQRWKYYCGNLSHFRLLTGLVQWHFSKIYQGYPLRSLDACHTDTHTHTDSQSNSMWFASVDVLGVLFCACVYANDCRESSAPAKWNIPGGDNRTKRWERRRGEWKKEKERKNKGACWLAQRGGHVCLEHTIFTSSSEGHQRSARQWTSEQVTLLLFAAHFSCCDSNSCA